MTNEKAFGVWGRCELQRGFKTRAMDSSFGDFESRISNPELGTDIFYNQLLVSREK